MMKTARMARVAICVAVAAAPALTGCTLDILEGFPNGNENANDNGSGGGMDVPNSSVEVRLRNLTADIAVDVQLHVANGPLVDVPAELFVDENFFGSGIGLGGNGRIGPGEEEVFDLDCNTGLTVGTKGGSFLDVETGEILGTGDQRWLQEGAQFSCGTVIVIEYRGETDNFTTSLSLLGG